MGKQISAKNIKIKRAYEKPAAEDGLRILIDRLWPRGLTKDKAAIDHWFKEIAPSTKLRKWFAHDPDRWNDFRRRYIEELKSACFTARRNSQTRPTRSNHSRICRP